MDKTIAALSTGLGAAPKAIIRLSGPAAFRLARLLVPDGPSAEELKGFSAPQVCLTLPGGARFLARMLIMRAPRSYTTKDMVEFHVPGSPSLARLVLHACLEAGAELAGPGEFTRQAYLGGRIDAAQAEGVKALIESRGDEDRRAALHLLRGQASNEARKARAELIEVRAAMEAFLDFTDEDSESLPAEALRERLELCRERLLRMEKRVAVRPLSYDAPRVVMLGPPNAGKSALFRRLVPSGRALISPLPGTTRDLLEGEVTAGQRTFWLVDTPGLGATRDPLERLALSRLSGRMDQMDLVLQVFDGSQPPYGDALRQTAHLAGLLPSLHVLNKVDLGLHNQWQEIHFPGEAQEVSALQGLGTERLAEDLAAALPPVMGGSGGGVDFQTLNLLKKAGRSIAETLAMDWHGALEIAAMELREATESIGLLTDKIMDEEVLDAVFSRFCIGK